MTLKEKQIMCQKVKKLSERQEKAVIELAWGSQSSKNEICINEMSEEQLSKTKRLLDKMVPTEFLSGEESELSQDESSFNTESLSSSE